MIAYEELLEKLRENERARHISAETVLRNF